LKISGNKAIEIEAKVFVALFLTLNKIIGWEKIAMKKKKQLSE